MRPLILSTLLLFASLPAQAEYEDNLVVDFQAPWDTEFIEKFARFPVQDGGRVKPFDTVARYTLLRIHGRQSIQFSTDPSEKPTKRSATEFALYAIFAPDSLKNLPLFLVDDSEAVVTVGFDPGQKRDRYSYNEVLDHFETLEKKAFEFREIASSDQNRIQKMVVGLHANVIEFQRLSRFLDFARIGIPSPFTVEQATGTDTPPGLTPGSDGRISLSGFVQSLSALEESTPDSSELVLYASVLHQIFTLGEDPLSDAKFRTTLASLSASSTTLSKEEMSDAIDRAYITLGEYMGRTRAELKLRRGDPGAKQELRKAKEVAAEAAAEGRWKAVQEALRITFGTGSFLTVLPPPAATEKKVEPESEAGKKVGADADAENDWFSPTDLTFLSLHFEEIRPFAVERLRLLESLAASVSDKEAFQLNADKLFALVKKDAGDQFQPAVIDREVSFFKADYFTNALVCFLLAFLLVIFSFLAPGSKFARITTAWVAIPATVIGLGLLTWGIVQRCLIMSRPPIGTLYETCLFIAATAVLVGLIIEYFNRRRLALVMAAFIGAGLLFVANQFHAFESKDTMDPLLAVLRTNFWLSVHVTTVCMGYSASLLAALIGYIYVIARLAGVREQDDPAKEITRMAYGVVCFGMLFSLFGTVTGGIWANYSWGRFWGWDPKENGAFMIVLWNMVILHARLGGYARQLGIHVLSIFGGAIVAFSWWHVNQLEVGLHSYGFTDGIMYWLTVFYGFTVFMLILASAVHIFKKSLAPPTHAKAPSKKASAS